MAETSTLGTRPASTAAPLLEVEALDVHRREVAEDGRPREEELVGEERQHVRVVAPVVQLEARELGVLVFGRPRARVERAAAVGDRGRGRDRGWRAVGQ